MTTFRSILAVALVAFLAAPVAARAQWVPGTPYYAPGYVPPPGYVAPIAPTQIMPEGHPPAERPWAPDHFFVWHDGGGWHLRITTSGRYHNFGGWVDSPSGLGGVNAVIPGTPLSVNGRQIQFNIGLQGGENGFDWQQQSPCARFNLLIDNFQNGGMIDIGAYSQHPNSYAPFEVCATYAPPPAPVAEQPPPEAPPEEVSTPLGPEMDVDAFQPALSAYGQWINVDPYGLIWQPNPGVVGPDFVPYGSGGHWIMTDAGWTWASDYPWGWATFHYGNWIWANGGWAWVPGRVWSPAWVNWRYGGGFCGWGPIGWEGQEIVFPGYHYYYVDNAHFAEVNFREYRVPPERIAVVERDARPMPTRYANGHVVVSVNAGPPRAEIEHASGHSIRPVPMAKIAAKQHMMPPAGAKGVHYANGASASHPFVAQKVQATNHPPAGGAHPEGGAHPMGGARPEGGGRPEGNAHPEGAARPAENARPEGGARPMENREASRPAEGQQREEARPAGGGPPGGGAAHPEPAHAAAPAAKPAAKPKQPPPAPTTKKKP